MSGELRLHFSGPLGELVNSLSENFRYFVFPSLFGPLLLLLVETLEVDGATAHRTPLPGASQTPLFDTPVTEHMLADEHAVGVGLVAHIALHCCCLSY